MLTIDSVFTDVVRLALGDQHSMILKQDGSLWSTTVTLLGRASARNLNKSFQLVVPSGATAVTAGDGFSLVVKQNMYVWAIGKNSKGQLGDGTKARKGTFCFVHMIPGLKDVAAGGYHSLLLTQNGRLWVAGDNTYGQLGDASKNDRFRSGGGGMACLKY